MERIYDMLASIDKFTEAISERRDRWVVEEAAVEVASKIGDIYADQQKIPEGAHEMLHKAVSGLILICLGLGDSRKFPDSISVLLGTHKAVKIETASGAE